MFLIPKETKPTSMNRFRPLSLCNVTFKLVSKAIVNRLKGVMENLLSPFQASFVLGRQGIDNAIVLQEFVRSMRFTKARIGKVVIKMDLEKAYDLFEWAFVEESVKDAGLPVSLVDVIMRIISSGACRLLWNGEETDRI